MVQNRIHVGANDKAPNGQVTIYSAVQNLYVSWKRESEEWCHGRMWVPRLILLAYFAWAFLHHLSDSRYHSLWGMLNLGIHELGHFVFKPLGSFMHFFGGSLFQCLVPCVGIYMFLRQGDFFAIAVGLCWLATNQFELATYIADARSMSLPLVTPGGGEATHDWNWLLGRLGILGSDQVLAFLTRVLAFLSMSAGLVYGSWLLWKMFRNPNS